jgi:hypothetical protein
VKQLASLKFQLEALDKILDREISSLSLQKLEHHKAWDAQILTLSTAAIGFSFTVLPIVATCSRYVLFAGVLSFALSIICVFSGYLTADKGLDESIDDHIERRSLTTRAKREFENLQIGIEDNSLEPNGAIDDYIQRADAIFKERDGESYSNKIDKINDRINFLNKAKTIIFVLGILLISTYSAINLSGAT